MKSLTLSILILAGTTSTMAQVAPVILHRGGEVRTEVEGQKDIPTPPPEAGIVENTPAIDFVLYPNPTSTVLNIRLDKDGQGALANILDMTGRVVMSDVSLSSGINTFDIGGFGSGVYTCMIHTNDGLADLKRFIVK
jgi:Secretion system C-terminal sorting domain